LGLPPLNCYLFHNETSTKTIFSNLCGKFNEMKHLLLSFALIVVSSTSILAQQDVQKFATNFSYAWSNYLLPNSPFLIYHGKEECYFIDSLGDRVPNHAYSDIKTGGASHFIVQDDKGFHILNAQLERVTNKPFDNIKLIYRSQLELTAGERTLYYTYSYKKGEYEFTDIEEPIPPRLMSANNASDTQLGKVNDARFKAKRIERLRLGIDMSQTLTVGQKRKNVLIQKGDTLVYKGPTKPMLFYDFAITGAKSPHTLYHPVSGPKTPLLENCERFWCVGSFLVVSIKGSPTKHVVSNTGEIILTSAGEIRYYEYEFGGQEYAFFCDGRSVVNLNGDVIYKSDGELIGVGEHYIYSGYSGAYLGDLSQTIQMNCSRFDRYNLITVGQTGRNEYSVYDPKSVLVNQIRDYYIDQNDSVIVCVDDSQTIVCDPFEGKVANIYPIVVQGRTEEGEQWKYIIQEKDSEGNEREGRFDPKKGVFIEAKYTKIEWPESEKYHIVLTSDGKIRYLDSNGQELFD